MLILHLVSNKVWGGGEQYVLDLAKSQIDEGHDVVVVCRDYDAVKSRFAEAGVAMLVAPLRGPIDFVTPFKLSRLIRSQRKRAIDKVIIHAHDFKNAFVALRARRLAGGKNVKIVVTRHQVKPAKTQLYHRSLYRQLDAVIFVSQLAKDCFLSSKPKVDEGKLMVVHNGIFVPAEVEMKRSDGHELQLMFHGRLSDEKGIETIIDALKELIDLPVRLSVIGSGPEEYVDSLKEQAKRNEVADRIDWFGFIAKPLPILEKADIGVCPSVCRESFGLSVVEYMSLGKPVITTNSGAQKEYIEDGVNGYLINPGDASQLAKVVRLLVGDADLRERVGTEARAYSLKNFAYQNFYRRIMSIYKRC